MVIGHGPLREAMEREAKALGVRAVFWGYQSQDKVRVWMNRCRIFCMPSKTANSGDSEGFGLVFAEAQAMGLPVVGYEHGGVPEAVEHGKTGLLATEGNVEQLAEYIRLLMDDEQLWKRMSAAGPKRVDMHFNRKRQIALLEDIYGEAMDDFASSRVTPVSQTLLN
jgi:glycosyltransferase involved in cell wall biosynthesis